MERRVSGRSRRAGAIVCGMLCAVTLAACAGENVFPFSVSAGEQPPSVDITAPTESFRVAVGDSIQIVGNVNAAAGAATVVYAGRYADTGNDAYQSETDDLGGVAAAALSNFLPAVVGQIAGSVYIVVEVTDQGGAVGKDSVKITIN